MSAYISFYLKSKSGEFLPIACFSRSNVYYAYAQDYVSSYDVVKPLNKETIKQILEDVRREQSNYKNYIADYEKRLSLIASMNNSVSEKLEAANEVQEYIDDTNELKQDLDNCECFYIYLLWIIEEAESTKYDSDKNRVINPDDYIYCGIECSLPNNAKNDDNE